MNIILSTTECGELNKLLALKSIPYTISLTDGCGWQIFRLKLRAGAAESTQALNQLRAVVYNYISARYPKETFDVTFHEGKKEFYIR